MKRFLLFLIAMLAMVNVAFAAVNINTATEAELDALKGIGPAKAKAIVEDRKANGPFKSPEDLKRVKGIGDKTFENLKGDITVTGATTVPAAAPKSDKAPAAKTEKAAAPAAAAPAAAPTVAPAPAATAKTAEAPAANDAKDTGKKSKKNKADKEAANTDAAPAADAGKDSDKKKSKKSKKDKDAAKDDSAKQ